MHDLGLGISSSGLFGLLPVMSLGVAAPLGARLVAWVRPGYLIIYAMLATICQIPFALLTGLLSRWMGGVRRLMTVATLSAVLACWGLLLAPLPLWPILRCCWALAWAASSPSA